MESLSFYQKFLIMALCAVWINSSAAELSDKQNNIKTIAKRFDRHTLASWGTNWCLDQITNPESTTGLGVFFQTDGCCKEHVKCTAKDKESILKDFPEQKDVINAETFRSCTCDNDFADCLKSVVAIRFKAQKVGSYYFNSMAEKCQNNQLKIVQNVKFNMSL